jgi:hypothetical protein
MATATFQISPQSDGSFNVAMTTASGQLRLIAGFGSEHEAAAGSCKPNDCCNSLIRGLPRRLETPSSVPPKNKSEIDEGAAGVGAVCG